MSVGQLGNNLFICKDSVLVVDTKCNSAELVVLFSYCNENILLQESTICGLLLKA